MILQPALNAVEELSVAHRIIALEEHLRITLRLVPECGVVLDAGADAANRTRQAALKRLAAANRLVNRAAVEPGLLASARATWAELETLTWHLALSAGRVARREARRVPCRDITVEDLEQEGVIGLHDAAQRFEPDRGVRFAVYARWWVRAQITKAIQHAGAFQISAGVYELHRNMHKLMLSDEKAGLVAPPSNLALRLGVRRERLGEAMELDALRPVDQPETLDGPSPLSLLPDTRAWTPEVATAAMEVADWLRTAIHTSLATREQRIMERRHGIDCEEASTTSIAADLALSAERVRQLEAQSRAVLIELFAREMDI